MRKFLENKKLILLLFLLILLLIDFFIVGKMDLVCRAGQGYGFGHPLSLQNDQISQIHFGWARVEYNFRLFFYFLGPAALGQGIS